MTTIMRAVVLEQFGGPEVLQVRDVPIPVSVTGQVLVRVEAFGLNRSELHFRRGMGSFGSLPRIPGIEAAGTVVEAPGGEFEPGQQVAALMGGMGRTIDGGYAELTVADERFCFALPDAYTDIAVAPLLCAGLIGSRALRSAGDPHTLGLYGFGAAAHIIAQVARAQGRDVYAFTRPGDTRGQDFARELGADLVVVGRRSGDGTDASVPGSVSAEVLRDAPCDVLVIR